MLNQRMVHYLHFGHSVPPVFSIVPELRHLFRHPFYWYSGYFPVRADTLSLSSANSCPFLTAVSTSAIRSATSLMSSSMKPRVVIAGVPRRIPLVTNGDSSSKGIVFLLHVIPTSSNASSACLPVRPKVFTSTSRRCVSVPPETTRSPFSVSLSASVRALFMTCS